jgi:hypothetical protein
VYSWDEEFNVRFRKYGTENDVRVKDVKFYVEANSVVGGGEHQITMGVHSGTTLDDVNIEFSPSGLAFSPAGTLTIALVGPVTAADVQQATHIYGDGSQVESITTVTDRKGNSFLKVVVKVPGFSRYSLGGGDDMYEMVDDEGWW